MVSSIKEAKEKVVAEKNKVVTSAQAIVGSRALLAVLTMLMVGFGTHSLFFPDKLPPIAGLDIAQTFGPHVDAGVLGAKLQEAHDAAIRQGAPERAQEFLLAHTADYPLYNWIGFAGSALLLALNMLAAASKWKGATGIRIGAA